jgi:hypothetical protein
MCLSTVPISRLLNSRRTAMLFNFYFQNTWFVPSRRDVAYCSRWPDQHFVVTRNESGCFVSGWVGGGRHEVTSVWRGNMRQMKHETKEGSKQNSRGCRTVGSSCNENYRWEYQHAEKFSRDIDETFARIWAYNASPKNFEDMLSLWPLFQKFV